MNASVRHYTAGRGSRDALMHRVDDEFASAISHEPGFVCDFARDTGDGTMETITIFHNKESAIRSNELAAGQPRRVRADADRGDRRRRRAREPDGIGGARGRSPLA